MFVCKLKHFDRTSSDVMERELANDRRKRFESANRVRVKNMQGFNYQSYMEAAAAAA